MAHKRLVEELDNKINGVASKQSIKAILQKERKRVKQKKSARKHRKQGKED